MFKFRPYAFFYHTDITSVNLPSTLRVIEAYGFSDCWELTKIKLPEGLELIDTYAFQWTAQLADVAIPDSVTFIGENNFHGARNIYTDNPVAIEYFEKMAAERPDITITFYSYDEYPY
jgi:hypothetical protein